MKRYVVVNEFYLWAEDDEKAVKTALKLAENEDKKFDNKCQVIDIVEQPVGRLGSRAVYGDSLSKLIKTK